MPTGNDVAGNRSSIVSTPFKIDITLPKAGIASAGKPYQQIQTPCV